MSVLLGDVAYATLGWKVAAGNESGHTVLGFTAPMVFAPGDHVVPVGRLGFWDGEESLSATSHWTTEAGLVSLGDQSLRLTSDGANARLMATVSHPFEGGEVVTATTGSSDMVSRSFGRASSTPFLSNATRAGSDEVIAGALADGDGNSWCAGYPGPDLSDASEPAWVVQGDGRNGIGHQSAYLDVTGDGVPELILATWQVDEVPPMLSWYVEGAKGEGWEQRGSLLPTTASSTNFGGAMETAHTVIAEPALVVADHTFRDELGARTGRVDVVPASSLADGTSTAQPTVTVLGGPHEFLGRSLAVGDIDGDGIEDLAVGAPGDPYAVHELAGSVYVFRGPLEPGVLSTSDASMVWTGSCTGEGFGTAVAIAQGDGPKEAVVLVGAPFHASQSINGGALYQFRL